MKGFWDNPIDDLPNTSSVTIRLFHSIGINQFGDLLNYFPTRYKDFSLISLISQLQQGEQVTIKGKVESVKQIYTRRGFTMQKVTVLDASSSIELTWFNQPYLLRLLRNRYLSASGEVQIFGKKISLQVDEFEILNAMNDTTIHTGRIVPVYSEKRGLSSKLIREKMNRVLTEAFHPKEVKEFFPSSFVQTYKLKNRADAYRLVHFPDSKENAKDARRRFAFEELFTAQLSVQLIKQRWDKEHSAFDFDLSTSSKGKLEKVIKDLPFSLTSAQMKVWREIKHDLTMKRPMNRFLQGDVGSGKTVVAGLASYAAKLNNAITLFMAPTEILAKQHFQTYHTLFPQIKTSLVTKNSKPTGEELRNTEVFIGTHALLNQKINLKKVGLVVTDEQHRFGVKQRALLKEKGINPHLLTMTATPIPRTVMLTIFGELDLSVIDEMPKGRLPIKTYVVPKEKRQKGYEWIQNQILKDKVQVFVVCPLIDESETETMQSVKAAKKEVENLHTFFPKLRISLLHGKMTIEEKNKNMEDFRNKKSDILVSTSVVEVGIDIPNATIMIIEGADRFGLAQLHQLRGRVGRGEKQSYCFLFTDKEEERILNKLDYFGKHQNGMDIAEYDLRKRGPGDIFGTKQHGYSYLRIASLSDYKLIEETKKAAKEFIAKYSLADYQLLNEKMKEYETHLISQD